MDIHRPFSNHASSGISHRPSPAPPQHRAQKDHRGTHTPGTVSADLRSVRPCTVQIKVFPFPTAYGPQFFQNFFHTVNICDTRASPEHTDPPVEQRSCHHGQRGIFGTLHNDTALKRPATCNLNLIQAVHSRKGSYIHLMQMFIFCYC